MTKRSLSLLLAVTREVDRLNLIKPKRPPTGGTPMRWPVVGPVMDYLQPGCGWNPNTARKAYKDTDGWSEERRDAAIASVDREAYVDTVAYVFERGTRPPGPVSMMPGIDQESEHTRHEGKRMPTPQERLEGIKQAEQKIMDRADELAEMEVEIEKAESRRRIAERMADHYKKRAAFVKSAMEMLRDIVVPLEPLKWDKASIPSVHIRRQIEAVLTISDVHVGDEIKADTMGALNVYNFDVFQEKSKRLYAEVKESLGVLQEYGNLRKMRVHFLGDITTGTNIFPGQAHHIEFGAMHQAIKGADHFATLLQMFLDLPGVEEEEVEAIPGNHGRPGKKGQDPFEDNWDLVLYQFMKLRLASEPRIKFNWHYSWWMMPNVLGWNFLCAHGDEVKAWNGIPNYGFRRWGSRWRELLDSVGKRYDYGMIGHHHVEVEEKNLIISGAWPGASFFSAKELQSGGEATQMLFAVTEDRGITWRRRLPLDPPRHCVNTEAGN